MGWITERRNRTGHGLAHGHQVTARMRAPLKKIVEVIRAGDGGLFSSGDLVLLECGHETMSKGMHRARCLKCASGGGEHSAE